MMEVLLSTVGERLLKLALIVAIAGGIHKLLTLI